jgi:hypothetical protein
MGLGSCGDESKHGDDDDYDDDDDDDDAGPRVSKVRSFAPPPSSWGLLSSMNRRPQRRVPATRCPGALFHTRAHPLKNTASRRARAPHSRAHQRTLEIFSFSLLLRTRDHVSKPGGGWGEASSIRSDHFLYLPTNYHPPLPFFLATRTCSALLCSALYTANLPCMGTETSLLFLALLCYAFGYAFGYAAATACCCVLQGALELFLCRLFRSNPHHRHRHHHPSQPTNHKSHNSQFRFPGSGWVFFPSPCKALAAPQTIGVHGIMGWRPTLTRVG